MTLTAEARLRLAALQEAPAPGVARFDVGPPLPGRVAVLSSAFNPPTLAHLDLMDLAAGDDGAAAALLSTNNVDKGLYGAPLEHRVGMLLAARSERPFAVLASNAARFVDQALALREAFPATTFDFVMGHDTLVRLADPKYYAEGEMERLLAAFFAHHRVIATNRGSTPLDEVEAFVEEHLAHFRERLTVTELPHHRVNVSSSSMRQRIESGLHPEDLPASVVEYIAANGLYRSVG